MQQQAAAARAAQQQSSERLGLSMNRSEVATSGAAPHLVHQIQHQPNTSSSSQRASTSMSALR